MQELIVVKYIVGIGTIRKYEVDRETCGEKKSEVILNDFFKNTNLYM